MNIQENISLKAYNTFGIDANAHYFLEITSVQQLQEALRLKDHQKRFVLSGGSNMLLTKDIEALVLYINIKGISIVEETEDTVVITAKAGENWHEFVLWALKKNFGGIENLSLIPGNMGTAPIQNIGAYGVELKDVFVSCEALHTASGTLRTFDKDDCRLAYRESIFKNEEKGNYIITSVTLKLTKKNHQLSTGYGAITEDLKRKGITDPTIQNISDAVITIRKRKLPDPKKIGNSGSFFKNPVVDRVTFERLQKKNSSMPFYEINPKQVKIPAGWLIEQSGYKGKRIGDAGVHDKQALVLVNYGNAKGIEILNLALEIQKTVKENFGIYIQPEVNIIK